MSTEWPPEGSPLAVTPEMEARMKQMSHPLVKSCDMTEEMRTESMDIIVSGIEKHSESMELACKMIKETMDKKYGGPWHVVAGEGFGFTVQYEAKNLCYMFFAGTGRRVAILLYKSCVI